MAPPPSTPPLPIGAVLPALREALARRTSAVLQAPPGAGKTTAVPLALLHEPWLARGRILMLEPRRLAARAAAARMAFLLGEQAGQTVGYRVRLDSRIGPTTRVEVVTEGILTRMLHDDAALDGVGLVIFDEFHERSLHADLGLALALHSRALLRPELRVLVMSATLDGAAVAALLGRDDGTGTPAPIITSEGRAHVVETHHRARRPEQRVEGAVAAAVQAALARDAGDVLAFLPGAGEIRRTLALLAHAVPRHVRVHALHGSLPLGEQDAAVAPAPPGERKVVLATSIAETSLTIMGVRVVVDGGLARVPRFSPRTGMTRLETVRVSRAAADQRRGRAGRTAPGVCYRLWSESDEAGLVAYARPELLEADLAPLALELAIAGIDDPATLHWLDVPPAAAFGQGRRLLRELGALDDAGRVTAHGRRMATLPLHPRLAHMVVSAEPLGLVPLACDLAALLGERDMLRGDGAARDPDLRLRVHALHGRPLVGWTADEATRWRVRTEAASHRRQMGVRSARDGRETPVDGEPDESDAGVLLAFAYPDRIAARRTSLAGAASTASAPSSSGARYLLRNGRGAVLPQLGGLGAADYIVAADLDDAGTESRIHLAAPIALSALRLHAGAALVRESIVEWDDVAARVVARDRERLGAIVLADVASRAPDREAVAAALLDGLLRDGIDALPWSDGGRRVRERLTFLHAADPAGWPDVSSEALGATAQDWLAPHLAGLVRRSDVARLDLGALLLDGLPWARRTLFDELAPTHFTVPTGNRIRIDYSDPAAPTLAVRLQELFGLAETPRVARGAVTLTLQLLSPAHRPVQTTRDLAGFWRGTYFDVRKDLKGRYPKHHWPDDPLTAPATSRAKRRGE